MDELIKITENDGVQTVSGRELHRALRIETPYTMWFSRMCKYGFSEGEDFLTNLLESTGGRPQTDHIIKLDMAKEISMIQDTPIGRQMRKYFISVEKQYRALQAPKPDSYTIEDPAERARRWAEEYEEKKALESQVVVKDQQIAEMQPKASYVDTILQSKDLVPTRLIAKDYGLSAERLNTILRDAGIQYKDGGRWYLYQKYAEMNLGQSKTFRVLGKEGEIQYKPWLCWTQSGRFFINDLLKSMNILPIVERPKQISLSEYDWGELWS